jgi:tetratricopeptide (TPR) repeat protein
MSVMRTPKTLLLAVLLGVIAPFLVTSSVAQSAAKSAPSVPTVEQLIAQRNFDQAESLLKARILQNPSDAHSITLLGGIREQQRLYRQAESVYREALRVNPSSPEAAAALSKLYSAEGRISDAVAVVEPLYRADPSNTEAKILLSSLYEKQAKFAESLSVAESLLTTPDSQKVLVPVITDRLMLNQPDQAQPLIAELLHDAAGDSQLVADLARAFMRHGMVADATELLKLASERIQPTASLLAASAEAQGRQGHLTEAQHLADRARQLNADSTEALFVSAQIAAKQSDWKSVTEFISRALQSAPPDINMLQGLAYAYMQVGDVDRAHAAAQLLYDLQPNSADAALSLALVDVRGKHWGEADPLLDNVLASRPNDKPAHLAKGIAKYNLGELDSAVQHLMASLGQGAPDGEAHYYMGLVAKQRGDLAAATKEMEAALVADPSHQLALSSAGQLYAQQGKLQEARSVLEKAVTKLPDDAQSHYQLATVYRRLSMSDQAREQLEIYQRLIAKAAPARPESK